MTVTQATSGADTSTSGDVSVKGNSAASTSGDAGDGNYPKEFVDKLKREKDNQGRKISDLQAELETLKSAGEQANTEGLEQKEQYRTLYEQEKEKARLIADEHSQLKGKVTAASKKAAVKIELMKLGLNAQHEATAFRLMDTSNVIEDIETGAMIGAEAAAKQFQTDFGNLGLFGKSIPGVDQSAPEIGKSVGNKSNAEKSTEEIVAELRELKEQGV